MNNRSNIIQARVGEGGFFDAGSDFFILIIIFAKVSRKPADN
jgi:hypothetical protein